MLGVHEVLGKRMNSSLDVCDDDDDDDDDQVSSNVLSKLILISTLEKKRPLPPVVTVAPAENPKEVE